MKCVICHGEDIQTKELSEEIKSGNNIIVVPIKAPTCMSCGERYYDRRTMKMLEDVEDKVSKNSLKLKEIGKILGCSEGTVKSRIFYTTRKLARELRAFNPYKAEVPTDGKIK